MRKRSRYRPRPVLADPLGFVLSGVAPAADLEITPTIRVRNNSALASLRDGTATRHDVDALIDCSNMTTALVRVSKGARGGDWRAEIRAGTDAIESIRNRAYKWGKVQATPTELAALELLVDIHDAQLDAISVVEAETAVKVAKRMIARAGV